MFELRFDLGPLHFSLTLKDDDQPQREVDMGSMVERAPDYDDRRIFPDEGDARIGFRR